MDSPPDPLSSGTGFYRALRQAFREMRDRKGPCPDAGALSSYLAGELTPPEAQRIRRHVECCGECDSILERATPFEKAAPAPPGWKATERRIAARLGLPEPQAGIIERLAGRMASIARHPLFAYALAVALLYPAYLGVSVKPQPASRAALVEPNPPSLKPARNYDLSQTRGAAREIHLAAGEDTFILSFFVPARPGCDYFANVNGVQTPLAAPDPVGNLYLVCDRRQFPPGEYRLRITEANRQTGQGREFSELAFSVN